MERIYKIRINSSFSIELDSALDYISNVLGSPSAAVDLYDHTVEEIKKRAGYPFDVRPFFISQLAD